MGYFNINTMDLLDKTPQEKLEMYKNGVKPTPETPNFLPLNDHLKSFMDFMVNLPTYPNKVSEDNLELDSPTETKVSEEEPIVPYRPKIGKSPNMSMPVVKRTVESINILPIKEADKDYLLKLGLRESALIPTAKHGSYRGIYQFNDDSLKAVGVPIRDYDTDINSQHEAALKYKVINLRILKDFQRYIGTTFKGIHITENGLAAASHLLGAGTVMDWFNGTTRSDRAKKGFVDGLGTHITEYFKLFE